MCDVAGIYSRCYFTQCNGGQDVYLVEEKIENHCLNTMK